MHGFFLIFQIFFGVATATRCYYYILSYSSYSSKYCYKECCFKYSYDPCCYYTKTTTLSTGGIIGVAVTGGIVLIVAITICVWRRYKHKKAAAPQMMTNAQQMVPNMQSCAVGPATNMQPMQGNGMHYVPNPQPTVSYVTPAGFQGNPPPYGGLQGNPPPCGPVVYYPGPAPIVTAPAAQKKKKNTTKNALRLLSLM
ncbi:uncharacterized protein LOC127708598 [Mytilus californianus]|uniref:uncharacterized protein LOC127708598 n=1 Tax=Mytilus californianus TaxID=6549 RepID=UPI002246DF57|nr:uncharacterized protein LOC127708598 [Mytilus californianus]